VDFISDVFTWLNDPLNWTGPRGIINRLLEHLQISAIAVLAAAVLALPISVWLGHKRVLGTVAVNVANVGRAIPSVAFVFGAAAIVGIQQLPGVGPVAAFVALVALAVPPMVTNAYVAVADVPFEIRDSARGMGLSDGQVLWRIELPLALPLIMAGVRTGAVQVVATATIVAFVGAGGLGRFIVDGFAVRNFVEVFAGAVLVALLSLATEVGLGVVQRLLTPRGLRRGAEETIVQSVAPGLAAGAEGPA
jgi:osmoprotectant transport system permease protein